MNFLVFGDCGGFFGFLENSKLNFLKSFKFSKLHYNSSFIVLARCGCPHLPDIALKYHQIFYISAPNQALCGSLYSQHTRPLKRGLYGLASLWPLASSPATSSTSSRSLADSAFMLFLKRFEMMIL